MNDYTREAMQAEAQSNTAYSASSSRLGSLQGRVSNAPSQNDLRTINARVLGAVEDFAEMTSRISGLADRILGSVPQSAGLNGESATPEGDIGIINATLDRLDSQRKWLRDEIQRLERL